MNNTNVDVAIIKLTFNFVCLQLNLIGRLQLSTERSQQEDNQSIVQLRILRTQEAIIKIMKMRKRLNNAALQVSDRFNKWQTQSRVCCAGTVQ